MDRPYGISDFAFPSRWDRESGPDLVERAGQGSRADREQSQTGRGEGSNSSRSRGGFDRPVSIYRGRDREYSLRESEVRSLTDLGKFAWCRKMISRTLDTKATIRRWKATFAASLGRALLNSAPSKAIHRIRRRF